MLGATKEDVTTGEYHLTVTQGRNGCQASSMIYVEAAVLANTAITLQGKLVNGSAQLQWNTPDVTQATGFDIERSTNGIDFEKVGRVTGAVGAKRYSFTDKQPLLGRVHYRIKTAEANRSSLYSNTVTLHTSTTEGITMYRPASANQVHLQLKGVDNKDLQVKVMTMDGRVLLQQTYPAAQVRTNGSTIKLQLPATVGNQPVIVAAYQDGYLLEARKL